MKNSKVYLQCMGACQYQNKLWFPNGGFNGLFSIKLKEFTVKYEQRIPYIEEWTQWAFNGNIHCVYNDKIFFFPYNCRHIMSYSIANNDIQIITISARDGRNTYLTAGIEIMDESVWIFPSNLAQGIFKLNLNTMRIECTTELDKALEDVENIYNYDNIIRLSDSEIAILSGKHSIIGIDLCTHKRVYCKQFEEIDIWGIRYDGSDFWLLLYDSTDVYRWNFEDDKLEKYQLLETDWINDKGVPYSNIIFIETTIILLPGSLKYIMRIDKETNTISRAVEYPPNFCFLYDFMNMFAFSSYHIIEPHNVLLYPLRGNMLLIYDTEKNQIEGRELTVTEEQVPYLKDIIKQKFQQEQGILYETDNLGIDLLDLAVSRNRKYRGNLELKQVGEKIYNTIVKE